MHITALTLYTPNLQGQIEFYTKVLELKPISQNKHSVAFQMGLSKLIFEYKREATPYHFAFNIPAHQDKEALAWLKPRVDILKDGANEIQDFSFWNAKAIYFYDADKNIVEFISRNNLKQISKRPFTSECILELSEIGLPSNNIKNVFTVLNDLIGIEVYDGSFERFCAIGDEHGLFICIHENRNWFPVGDKAYLSDFKITLEITGKTYTLEFVKGHFKWIG